MDDQTLKLPKGEIEIEVHDKSGKLIKKAKFTMKSFTGRIVELLSAILSSWSSATFGQVYYVANSRADITTTSNTTAGWGFAFSNGGISVAGANAPAGVDSAGIVVGTDATPVSITDYALKQKISHGSGSGQLVYNASSSDPIIRGSTFIFRQVRTFTNQSGAEIIVRELGWYVLLACFGSPYAFTTCIARDVPSEEIAIPDGSILTVRYIISYTLG